MIIGLNGKPLALFIGGILFAFLSIPFLRQKDLKNDVEKIGFSYKEFIKKYFQKKEYSFSGRVFIVG